MNPLRLAAFSLTAVSLLALGSACSSDSNPFDATTTTTTVEKNAKIRLEFNVAETRALSTSDEQKLTYVSIYVFDENGILEKTKKDHNLSTEGQPELEVAIGNKTVYAIAGTSLKIPTDGITTMDEFESIIFDSQVSNLKNGTGFMMIGKSDPKSVYYTVEGTEVPASNIFTIELVRLVAKTQVKVGNAIDTSTFGFTMSVLPTFRVAQTCDKMQIKHDGSDVITNYQDAGNGSFIGYTAISNEDFEYVKPNDFSADFCKYLTENIVSNPTSGNTTFVVLKAVFIPTAFYTCQSNATPQISSTQPSTYANTFYAVGIADPTNGYEDFTIDPSNKHVYVFQSDTDALNYATALNGGVVSAMTVSEDDAPMKAPRTRASNNFQVMKFEGGNAYYRINITDGDVMKVERNKYYKITVNSIKSLGAHSEDMLRPTNPNSDFYTPTSAMIGAAFKVAEWDEVGQDVDLD